MPQTRPTPAHTALLAGLALLLAALATPGGAQDAAPLPQPGPAAAEPPDEPAAGPATDPPAEDAAAAQPDPEADPQAEADLFALPRLTEAAAFALFRLQTGDPDGAAEMIDALIARHPGVAFLHANRAGLAMLAGAPETALDHLETAAALGFPGLAGLAADPLFAPLAADPAQAARLAALAAASPAAPPAPVPAPVAGGRAPVSAANTAWNPAAGRLEVRFAFPPAAEAPVLPEGPKVAARDLLREHFARSRAAGNHGDLYDNRDRGHSRLDPAAHPQVTHVTYADAARANDLDYGVNEYLLFDRVTFGNSSTAMTSGPEWRSMTRYALTRPDGTGPVRLWQNAAANHLYVYPSHRDYTDEQGDLFPANTPYVLVSRGSSGSDRPFLEAVAMILAAFRPDTKARLIEERMVVPTVQMVFRRSLQHVTSRALYFSGAAHPAVFEGYQINLARMVSLANAIAEDAIPTEVRIRVLEEDRGAEGVDFFGQGLSETFFDTPAAVARVWRSRAGRRSMVVSAEESRDANGRPLEFHWHLLQGDPEKVTIEPLDGGRRARITLDWHDPFRISEDNPLTASRVDIGVFAHNGAHDSAPAILSWYFPPHEARSYEPGPDGAPRIVSIDHAAPDRAETYADPLLLPRADWRDTFHYDDAGRPAGWTRHRGYTAERFTAEGHRILTEAPDGSPQQAEAVVYALSRGAQGELRVEELSSGQLIDYQDGVARPDPATAP